MSNDNQTAKAKLKPKPIKCSRCGVDLEYKGTKAFHEYTRWGGLGEEYRPS